jgi:hypothetical protein
MADGAQEVSAKNVHWVSNSMKVVRGLPEQRKYWTEAVANNTILGQLARKAISYCEAVQGESSKPGALQMPISGITLTNEKGELLVRHQLGMAILLWLPTTDN